MILKTIWQKLSNRLYCWRYGHGFVKVADLKFSCIGSGSNGLEVMICQKCLKTKVVRI